MATSLDPNSFVFLMNDLVRLIRSDLDKRIESAGIGVTSGEARALVHVARLGEARQNVLAERMGVEAMTLSSYLDRLERQGLIQREADPSDRRAKLVRLTAAADQALESIVRIAREVQLRAKHGLDENEWQSLQRHLTIIRKNFIGD